MNHDIPSFDDAAHEREWQAQERALQAERLGLDPASDDARVRRYRLLARSLREPMPVALPADFARQMAAQVAASPTPTRATEGRLVFTLTGLLAVTLVVTGGVVLAMYGNTWLPTFRSLLPASGAPATGWVMALGCCLGASWLLGVWQQHVQGTAA